MKKEKQQNITISMFIKRNFSYYYSLTDHSDGIDKKKKNYDHTHRVRIVCRTFAL